MPHDQAAISDVVSNFVSDYIHALMSDRCRDDQWGLAFLLEKLGPTFVAVNPDPAVDSDPTAFSPRERFPVLAHAVFKPEFGRVSFNAPAPGDGSPPAVYEMEDPVYIHVTCGEIAQLWMLSLNRLQEDGEPIFVHRADPASVRIQERRSAPRPDAASATTLH